MSVFGLGLCRYLTISLTLFFGFIFSLLIILCLLRQISTLVLDLTLRIPILHLLQVLLAILNSPLVFLDNLVLQLASAILDLSRIPLNHLLLLIELFLQYLENLLTGYLEPILLKLILKVLLGLPIRKEPRLLELLLQLLNILVHGFVFLVELEVAVLFVLENPLQLAISIDQLLYLLSCLLGLELRIP